MKILKNIFGRSDNRRKCFEQIDQVFHDPKDLDLVFYPLISINLKEIIPTRDEWIHFVDIWNNGAIEDSIFDKYRTRDTIRFKLEDSKYHYYGNKKAFPKFSKLKDWKKESLSEFDSNKIEYVKIPTPQEYQKSNRRSNEIAREKIDFDYFLYVDQQISYLVNKERFNNNGKLITHKSFPNGYNYKVYEPTKQIGGQPKWKQRDMTPKDSNGKPLTFIGQVIGFNYMQNGSDNIYLFLNEETDEVIQIFQFG